MSNYYEFLKVPSAASIADIQIAIDAMYNQSRRLVTHHDPNIVQNANQNLLMIEQARATLLNPVKRADYDAMLSLSSMGGLVDTSAQSSPTPTMTPPMVRRPLVSPSMAQVDMGNDIWLCPKCSSANLIGTRFCKKCGNQLGRNCPRCNTLLESTAQFCSDCGVNVREYEQQKEIELAEAERQRIMEERRLAESNAQLGTIMNASTNAHNFMAWGWGISLIGSCIPYLNVLIWLAGLGLFSLSIINALKALRQSQQYGDQEFRSKAKTALWLSGIPIALSISALLFFIFIFFASILSNLSNY